MTYNKKIIMTIFIVMLVLVSFNPLFAQKSEQNPPLNPDSTSGPWLESENQYFRFVYKEIDEGVAEKYLEISEEVFKTVTGFFQCLPSEKPLVILYGAKDAPPFGGVTTGLPMRIGLMINVMQQTSYKSLLVHEFTHYMHASTGKTGYLLRAIEPFSPDLHKLSTIFTSDLSKEGTTSFLDGLHRSELDLLPVRAAVLDGQMWNYDQVSSGGVRFPGNMRVYLSGFLIQDWLFKHCGEDAFIKIQTEKDNALLMLESQAFKEYTGIDFKIAWGDIRRELSQHYSFAQDLPDGKSLTPRDASLEPQWYSLHPTKRGYLHYRSDLQHTGQLGFWRPDEKSDSIRIGKLAHDPGKFIPLKGIIAHDFASDNDAGIIAAILNSSSKTDLWHDENKNRLLLARVEWTPDLSEACAKDIQVLPGSGFRSPCLSSDGQRLFVTQRKSDFYYGYEYQLEDNNLRPLNLPQNISVTSLEISPDNKYLAVAYVHAGLYDVGIYDLEADEFLAVTNDEARDLSPCFLSDGSFVFSSDRENTIAIYSYVQGQFARICIDRVSAYQPVGNDQGGFYYSSYSAFGNIIKEQEASELHSEIIPDFLDLKPDWIKQRDHIWEVYEKKGSELLLKENQKETVTRNFCDIAMPREWSPLLSYGVEGFSIGVSSSAYSYLNENNYYLALLYNPDSQQLMGDLGINLNFPFMTASLAFQQEYFGRRLTDKQNQFSLNRNYSLKTEFPLFFSRTFELTVQRFQFLLGAEWREKITRDHLFNLAEGLSFEPERSLFVTSGLGWSENWPAPPVAFLGGSGFSSAIQGVLEADLPSLTLGFGALGVLNARLQIEDFLFSAFGRGAWRQQGGANEMIPPLVSRWQQSSTAPWYAEAGIQITQTALMKEYSDSLLLTDLGGMVLGVKSFWQAEDILQPQWLSELEFTLDFADRYTIYYSPIVVQYGVGYRLDVRDLIFNPEDLCFRLTIGNNLLCF